MKALVTNCTRNSGLTVMRALAGTGWSVVGSDDRVFPFGLRSRSAAAPYRRLPAEGDPQLTAELLALLEQIRPEVLIPTRGIEAACHARAAILARTTCLLPSPQAFAVVHDKQRLLEQCAAHAIAVPRQFDTAQATRYLEHAPGSQLVIKPRRDVGGGQSVHFVSDPAVIVAIFERVSARHGGALITEYIPGPTDCLRALHLLFDRDSRLIGLFVMRKLRLWPTVVGSAAAAISTHETQLVTPLLPLFEQLQWQGPVDAELKIDPRDGQAKILEINPRFSGAIHFPIACGLNFPQLFCRAALGERLAEARVPGYPAGMHYLDGGRWLRSLANELRAPGARRTAILRRAWREELRRPRVASIHRLSDPGPILGKLLLRTPAEAAAPPHGAH
jgi:biotin carboxylase